MDTVKSCIGLSDVGTIQTHWCATAVLYACHSKLWLDLYLDCVQDLEFAVFVLYLILKTPGEGTEEKAPLPTLFFSQGNN